MDIAILDGKRVKEVDNHLEWLTWFNTADRHVLRDETDSAVVSTVFLGLNHGWTEDKPLWFETMIFGGKHDGYQEHYETWEEAEQGHRKALALIQHIEQPLVHEQDLIGG